ncbi:unnamed protein product [Ectocarpus sp. 8 AP-2014]
MYVQHYRQDIRTVRSLLRKHKKSSISCCEGCLRRPNLGLVYSVLPRRAKSAGSLGIWPFAELPKCPQRLFSLFFASQHPIVGLDGQDTREEGESEPTCTSLWRSRQIEEGERALTCCLPRGRGRGAAFHFSAMLFAPPVE